MAAVRRKPLVAEADRAKRFFLDQARQLPGVLGVETAGGKTLAEQSLIVYITKGDIETERRVYALKLEVYDQHPDARLDVRIEEASATEASPQLRVGSV